MCGRFARRSTQEVLADWFGVELEDMPWFAPRITPGLKARSLWFG
jgi:hypothetical protein